MEQQERVQKKANAFEISCTEILNVMRLAACILQQQVGEPNLN
jgi:hypothetical protein